MKYVFIRYKIFYYNIHGGGTANNKNPVPRKRKVTGPFGPLGEQINGISERVVTAAVRSCDDVSSARKPHRALSLTRDDNGPEKITLTRLPFHVYTVFA